MHTLEEVLGVGAPPVETQLSRYTAIRWRLPEPAQRAGKTAIPGVDRGHGSSWKRRKTG